ncbi:MAG TPA: pentapeptide repeat-containing protein [Phormidium sp.]
MNNATIRQQYPLETLKEMVRKADNGTPQDFSYQYMRELELDYDTNEKRSDLSGCNLGFANLSNMELGGVMFSQCNLRGANLSGSSLRSGYLDNANLTDANLENCVLVDQFIDLTNFTNANLSGANLDDSHIGSDCTWDGVNLSGAYYGCDKKTGVKIMMERPPLIVDDIYSITNHSETYLEFNIYVFDAYIRIGCQTHSYKDWLTFDQKKIEDLGGNRAKRMFQNCRDFVIELAERHGCSKD